jgi:uncharacterized protein YqeY
MTIIEKLKIESLNLRKTRNPVAASITFAISEIEKVGKNNGNRATTEDEAIRVIQKLIATIDENIGFAKQEQDEGRLIHLNYEKHILSTVLPEMVSLEEVREYLVKSFVEKPANKGIPMKVLKEQFGSKVDMKAAGNIVSELYGF